MKMRTKYDKRCIDYHCGIQKRDGETDEPIETVTPGEYYFRNGKHYILYEEVQEGIAEVTNA